jgi:hypothetical protein
MLTIRGDISETNYQATEKRQATEKGMRSGVPEEQKKRPDAWITQLHDCRAYRLVKPPELGAEVQHG